MLVEVHITVDPFVTVRDAHEVASNVEAAIRRENEDGAASQAIVHVEPAEPPHTRPDPLFGRIGDPEAGTHGATR